MRCVVSQLQGLEANCQRSQQIALKDWKQGFRAPCG